MGRQARIGRSAPSEPDANPRGVWGCLKRVGEDADEIWIGWDPASEREPVSLRSRTKPTRAQRRTTDAWERDLGMAPGEQASESFVAYFEPDEPLTAEVGCEFADAFGLRERGELVNAVFTDRGRLVLRMPDGARPIAFDSKRPAAVEILGPTSRRLTGARGGAERTQLVAISSRGGASVRIILAESAVDALLRWGSERVELAERAERVSA
jgi:hypothetical protein